MEDSDTDLEYLNKIKKSDISYPPGFIGQYSYLIHVLLFKVVNYYRANLIPSDVRYYIWQ